VTPASGPDALARPIAWSARYGAGLDRTVCLGGGGLFFIAWQVGYLHQAMRDGVPVGDAERIVGTSAGSIVGTVLAAGRIERLHAEITAVGHLPGGASESNPAVGLRPSQERARAMFVLATDSRPETIRAIGHAALAALAPAPTRVRRSILVATQQRRWPSTALHITCVDAFTGERCVITSTSGVSPSAAATASSAVPGVFAPAEIGDRRCMDGGVSGSGLHTDLVAGAGRCLVLSLVSTESPAMMTLGENATMTELSTLADAGTRVFVRSPAPVPIEVLMDPSSMPGAMAAGAAAAQADRDELSAFWS
jgi:NTE family protein